MVRRSENPFLGAGMAVMAGVAQARESDRRNLPRERGYRPAKTRQHSTSREFEEFRRVPPR